MAEQLVIYLHDLETLEADWVFTRATATTDGDAISLIESGTVNDLVEKNKNAVTETSRIVCIIKSQLINYSEVSIPAKNRQRALQAIPFALEDQLAEDIEDLHFAIGKATNNNYPVASISHQSLKNLLEKLQQAGIKADALYADILSLALTDNSWNILQHQQQASIQTNDGEAISCDTDLLPVFIASLVSQKADKLPESIHYYLEENDEAQALSLPEPVTLTTINYKHSPLTLFCSQLSSATSINLLQGTYQVTRESKQWWRPWKAAAIIAAIALLLHLLSGGFELNRLQQQNQLIKTEIERIYKKSFPRSKKIVNARVQMENKLKQLKKGSDKSAYSFTDILLDSAPLIKQTAGAELQGISYRNHKLEMQLLLDKLSTAESLKNQLNQLPRIKAELLSASSEAKQVNARIQLEAL